MKSTPQTYDLAIVGTGLSGSIMGAIAARHGYRVLLIERGQHPRFAIGESVLPKGSLWFRLLAARYDVPELEYFGSAKLICRHVAPTTGRKIVNGFLYHRSDERQRPEEAHVFVPGQNPLGWDSHLFRADTDDYLVRLAQSYGAEYRDRTELVGIDMGRTSSVLTTADGDKIRARYVLDATGGRSPIAEWLGLRETPTRCKTRSRSIFTHMSGVRDFGELLRVADRPPTRYGWRDGTMQHVFAGGWFWIIPFGNHGDSQNQLCSVGVVLDGARHPSSNMSAEREFYLHVNRFPSIAAQLQGAKAVRPFIKTGRLQYSAHSSALGRVLLTANAYGFIDPLHSRGILCTHEHLFSLADVLLSALKDDGGGDLAPEPVAALDRQQARLLDFCDRHTRNFYTSFAHYPLWNAWLRLHVMNEFLGYMAMVRRYALYLEHRDPAVFGELGGESFPSSIVPNFAGLSQTYDRAETFLDRYRQGTWDAETAAGAILTHLSESEYLPPMFDWSRPAHNHIDTTAERSKMIAHWGRQQAPADLRQHIFAFSPSALERAKV